jgi:hypothetical protein
MAAVMQFSESNGAGETVTDGISNLNFGSVDSTSLDTSTYPITRGNNSFSKYIRAKFSGTFTTISNMLFWKSVGSYVTGETINAAANTTWAQPNTSSTGDSLIPASAGTALTIQSSAGTSTISAPGYTKYIRLQLATTVSTPSGAVNQKTFTFQWDEV